MAGAILLIRAGLAASLLLLVLRSEPERWVSIALGVGGLPAIAGVRPEWTAGITSLGWLATAGITLARGADWFGTPVRAVLFAILFAVLAVLGGHHSSETVHQESPLVRNDGIMGPDGLPPENSGSD